MDIKLDVHTHTVASGHAYSTIQEMAREAANRGLEILGITEHTHTIPGSCDDIYFRNLHVVPREMYGVRLMLGAELNILDTNGTVDMESFYYKMMDIRIAGIHMQCWKGGTKDEDTSAMVTAMHNPWVQIISHPGDGAAQIDISEIVKASKETGTLLEINNSSMKPVRKKDCAIENNLEILRLCKQNDIPVILGSDAHISFSIADYQYIWPLIDQVEFPQELIVNDKPELFLSLLKPAPLIQAR